MLRSATLGVQGWIASAFLLFILMSLMSSAIAYAMTMAVRDEPVDVRITRWPRSTTAST